MARFIAVEGIDAAGKSTVSQDLSKTMDGAVLLSRETATELLNGYARWHVARLRQLIWGYPPGAHTSVLGVEHWRSLLTAWYAAVDELIVRPTLVGGRDVVADSWYYKFVARLALTIGLRRAGDSFAALSQPDTVVWLDVPPEICVQRRSSFRATEAGEWQAKRVADLSASDESFVSYQRRVREVYLRLAARHGWRTIRAEDPVGVRAALAESLGMLEVGP